MSNLRWFALKKKTNFHENVSANQRKLGKKVSEVLCRNLKHPKMLIEIKNITVWSFFVQVCAGLHWNFHESIKNKKWKKGQNWFKNYWRDCKIIICNWKEYLSNVLVITWLPQFFVFWDRDLKFWLQLRFLSPLKWRGQILPNLTFWTQK